MEDKLAWYIMHGFASKLYRYLGWSRAQGVLSGVGQELIDEIVEAGEVEFHYNDIDKILTNISSVLVKKYKVADSVTFEISNEMEIASAAIMHPYRVFVKNCIFQGMHPLLTKYRIRRDWKRTLTGQDGISLVCPLMNMLTYAIDNNSDYLAGHCLEAKKQEGNICICLIDVFSREVDIVNFPEAKDPECYRIK